MGYDRTDSMLNYFAPNIPVATTDAGVLQEIDIGASSADHGEYVCFRRCTVTEIIFAMTGELAGGSSTAPTVVFTKRPTPLSATDESVVGTLTIPDQTAVGKVIRKRLSTPVNFAVGDSMEIAHTVGVGTPTGMGVAYFLCEDDPEYISNESDLSDSA